MNWKIAACAEQGSSHKSRGVPCQDKVGFYADDSIVITALADGAGSYTYAELGAEITIKTAINVFKDSFDQIISCDDAYEARCIILDAIVDAIKEKATELQVQDIIEFSATLLITAVKDGQYLVFHVGDGVIAYVKNNVINVASKPVNGEYANQTFFCTCPEPYENADIIKGPVDDIMAFILMSDGVEASFYDFKTETLSQDLIRIPRWTVLYPAETMEESLRDALVSYICLNTGDDCSIAVMAQKKYAGEALHSFSESDMERLFEFKETNPNKRKKRIQKIRAFFEAASCEKGCSSANAAKILDCGKRHVDNKLQKFIDAGVIEKNKTNGNYMLSK